MSYRRRKNPLEEEHIHINTTIRGGPNVVYHRKEFVKTGKIKHKINGSFSVEQTKKFQKDTIKFHILTDSQHIQWMSLSPYTRPPVFSRLSKNNVMDPQDFLFSSKDAESYGEFEVLLENESVIYFVLDNSFSSFSTKNVDLKIWEEWDEALIK